MGGPVWGSGEWLVERAMHCWRVIEMESELRREIISCQAWARQDNELHFRQR